MRKKSKAGRAFSGKILLELFAAAFVLLGPTVLGGAMGGWGLYGVFILTAVVFAVRLAETKRIHISVNILMGAACLLYALFVLIWADNPYGQVRLIFTLATLCLSAALAADYFDLEKGSDMGGRLTSMLVFSAFICAVWNIAAWGILRRFSLSAAFDAGLGDSDLVGFFMLTGLWCWRQVFVKGRRVKGPELIISVPMVFVLVMSRSFLTGLIAGGFALWAFARKKRLGPALLGGAVTVLSAVGLVNRGIRDLRPFADGLVCGLRNIGGLGGGGFLLRQMELQSAWYSVDRLGLGAEISSSLGLVGLIIFLAVIGWALYLAFARHSLFSAFGVFLCMFGFFVPSGVSLAWLMLLSGVLIYGEWRQGRTVSIRLRIGRVVLPVLLGALAVYGAVLASGDIIRYTGLKNNSGDELALAARLNPLDGESCFLAAKAYHSAYNSEHERSDIAYAEYYISLAIERCGETGRYRAEYASIKADSGHIGEAVEMDGLAMELAPYWEDCRVQAAEHLYDIMETTRKGSLVAQNYHQRILELGNQVNDMEKKKLINDYADRAQPYTRMEFEYESEEPGEEEE